MKKVQVDNKYDFEIGEDGKQLVVNGVAVQLDIKDVSEGHFHFLLDNKSYSAELVEIDYKSKAAIIKVNGKEYHTVLKDEKDDLLNMLGIETNVSSAALELRAPMPGLVLDILVKPGDQIKKGDPLLILEAMKMENLIKSPADYIIKAVEIQQGDKVEKNQVLLRFD